MEHDRAGLEQNQIAFLKGRNLPKRMQRQMRRLFHRPERDMPDAISHANFLERPTHPRIPRKPPTAIGRSFKGRDEGGLGCVHGGFWGWIYYLT